ncbi:MAG: hypothetical protein ACR2GR_07275 [Rhodothermales bacterium]
MPKTLVGLYNDLASAQQAVRELEEAGFGKDHLRTTSQDKDFENAYRVDAGRVDTAYLSRHGIPGDEAGFYADGIEQGGFLILAHVQDPDAEAAAQIMGRYAPVVYEPASEELQPSVESEAPLYATHGVAQETSATGEAVDADEETRPTTFVDASDTDETYHVAESVTVTDTDDDDEEDTTTLFASDAASYDEDDDADDRYDVVDVETSSFSGVGQGDRVSYTEFVEKLATVSAQLAQLREEVARLRTRTEDQAERIIRLEQREDLLTERAQSAATQLETRLTERITRLEATQRRPSSSETTTESRDSSL